jgi:hypothetical protein
MTQLVENPYEMRAEMWLPYPLNENYSVSNLGRVKSANKVIKYCDNDHFNIKINGRYKERSAKSLVKETFNNQIHTLEGEIWKDIKGYECYQISTFARVKSLVRNNVITENILKQYKDKKGYMSVTVQSKKLLIHQLVARHFIQNNDLTRNVINHINGDASDNRVENLEWVTSRENTHHGKGAGNHPCLYKIKNSIYFKVYIYYNKKSNYLGQHELEEALKVRNNFFKEKNINSKYL